MCTGLEIAALVGAGASVAGTVLNKPKAPAAVAAPDPAKERAKAEAEATQKANAKISMQRKAMRENSLLTGAGTLGATTQPAGSRSTLGV